MMKFEKSLFDLTMREMLAAADELYEHYNLRLETTDIVLVFSWNADLLLRCENLHSEEIFEFVDVEFSGEVANAVVRSCYLSTDSL